MKKKWITAEEHERQLAQNPQYQEMMRKKEANWKEREKEIDQASISVLDALRREGVYVEDIWQLAQRYAPLSRRIVDIILEYLPRVTQPWLAQGLVRQLAATRVKFSGKLLTEMYDQLEDDSFKWAIGNTFSCTNVQGIENWLARTLVDERHGKAREMLCIATGRILPKDQARSLLILVFNQLPGHAAMGLGYCGDLDTIAFLRSKGTNYKTWIKKEISKCIRKIERSVEKEKAARNR